MCLVWISEQTAIISLYSINWLMLKMTNECFYWGWILVFIYNLNKFIPWFSHIAEEVPGYSPNSKLHYMLLIQTPQPNQLFIILHLPEYNFTKVRLLRGKSQLFLSFSIPFSLSLSLSLSLPSVLFLLVLLLVFRLQMTNIMAFRCFTPLCKFFRAKWNYLRYYGRQEFPSDVTIFLPREIFHT